MRTSKVFISLFQADIEQEKAQYVLWHHETKSPITIRFQDYKSIIEWHTKF